MNLNVESESSATRMSTCDEIRLSQIPSIQDNGFLVFVHLKDDNMYIDSVSSNISQIGQYSSPLSFIGKTISKCFSETFVSNMWCLHETFKDCVSIGHIFYCDFEKKNFCVTIIDGGSFDEVIFEIIPDDPDDENCTRLRKMDMWYFSNNSSSIFLHEHLDTLFAAACSTITDIIPYDRAFVYQFQEDFSGKVVYEWIDENVSLEPYLNMYFPASDIPLPARQMFLNKNVRLIFDNKKQFVDIIGSDKDLSDTRLRGVHPVHLSYMNIMGVRSSMSIGLIIDGSLWGLLTFHSYCKPVYPTCHDIPFLDNWGTCISSRISQIQKESYATRKSNVDLIMQKISKSSTVLSFLNENARHLLEEFDCDFMSFQFVDCPVATFGKSSMKLGESEMQSMMTDCAKQLSENWLLRSFQNPSRGVLCVCMKKVSIIFVRKSNTFDKVWSGDPSHVKLMRPDGVPGPRGSFARYVESGADSNNQWDHHDRQLAIQIASILDLHVSLQISREQNKIDYSSLPTRAPIIDPSTISHFSHEIKTPLHTVSNVLTLLLEDSGITILEKKELQNAFECVQTVSTIVDSILNLAGGNVIKNRAEKNREHIVIGQFLSELEKTFEGKPFSTNLVGENETIFILKTKLYNVLYKMIENSLMYLESGTVELTVSHCSTHREATLLWQENTEHYEHRRLRNAELPEHNDICHENTSWYTFTVKHSGIGIHNDMLTNVLNFHDSSKISSRIHNSHHGVGPTIYESLSDVFDMRGTFGIASTFSEGTLMSAIVPTRVDVDPASKTTLDVEGIFFVVDDNAVNRKLASRLVKIAFKKIGCFPEIRECSNGRICVEEIKRLRSSNKTILGILLDYHMPVMSGKDAAIQIRFEERHNGLKEIPILGFTADTSQSVREDLLMSGMNDVLPKPMPMSLLQETCLKIVDISTNKYPSLL